MWKSWIWRNGEFCEKSWDLKIFGKNLGIWRTLLKILGFGEIGEKSWDLKKFVKNLGIWGSEKICEKSSDLEKLKNLWKILRFGEICK